jgi:hypothetical protein
MESSELSPEEKAGKTWEWLKGIYGRQLTNEYGQTMPESWVAMLGGLSTEQLRTGLRQVARARNPYPPKLMELVSMCDSRKGAPDTTPEYAKLPPPEKDDRFKELYSKAMKQLATDFAGLKTWRDHFAYAYYCIEGDTPDDRLVRTRIKDWYCGRSILDPTPDGEAEPWPELCR